MLKLNGKEVKLGQFPNGESYIDLDAGLAFKYGEQVNTITLQYESDKDLMGLVYLTDYLQEKGFKVDLFMPYIPYSRMDRVEGNRLFTLKSVMRLINSLGFENVKVYEPHSDVSVALLDRVIVENTTSILAKDLIRDLVAKDEWVTEEHIYKRALERGIYLVYPDAGASKRYGKQLNYSNVIECSKERDFVTGRINKLNLSTVGDFSDCKTAIIVDDLCSRGGTFSLTAKALRENGIEEIYLVVTHCENTIFDGELLTTDYIKEIITTDSILTKRHEKIKIR